MRTSAAEGTLAAAMLVAVDVRLKKSSLKRKN